jgi:hypothetical protein
MAPIRESQRALYPADWPAISKRIRERAGNACECAGECGADHTLGVPNGGGVCLVTNGSHIARRRDNPADWVMCWQIEEGNIDSDPFLDPIKVVLTVAHLDHDPTNNADGNLKALCQFCHLRYDRHEHAKNARATRRARKAAGELF